ncbi:MAG: 3-oxoacyl-[acyl-carrier-protein] reductase [Phycisphaerae bacterium]|nr:3-oxoacyl-[acyl-carrier-protein] reductase [Phycisphaerae bacterium]
MKPGPGTKDLLGKVALVTGGSRGIGRAICEALAAEQATIVVNYVSKPESANEVVEMLKRDYQVDAVAYKADIAKVDECDQMVEQIMAKYGHVDVLVNNAGVTQDKSFLKMTLDQWRGVLTVNLDGVFNITHKILPQMVKREWGRIVNITSIVGQIGNFGQANYATAKGGLIAFTKTLAREVAKKGVMVNAVAPGYIETDMTAKVSPEVLKWVCDMTPVGRLGRPDEVARAVRFLAAPNSGYITGQVINVNGGMYM